MDGKWGLRTKGICGIFHSVDLQVRFLYNFFILETSELEGKSSEYIIVNTRRRTVCHADDVRRYCKDNKIDPARKSGKTVIEIRAGDIHAEMKYKNRMPWVCAALGASKFEEYAQIERISLTGPTNGANAIFTFRIK